MQGQEEPLAPASPPRRAGAHCSEGHTPFLHRKVFHKLHFCVSEGDIQKVVANTPGAIEPILCALKEKVVDGAVREDPPGAGVLVGAFVRTAFEPAVCQWETESKK